MGRTGRPAILDRPHKRRRLLQVMAQTGNNKAACNAIGMDESCLYKYRQKHPEFDAEFLRARDSFFERDDPELAARVRAAYLMLLQPHDETWTTFETVKHADGRTTETRKVHKAEKPPVQWAVTNLTPLMNGRPAGEGRSRMELTGADGTPLNVASIVITLPDNGRGDRETTEEPEDDEPETTGGQ